VSRIFYYCFANAKPTGGNKIVYRHVQILRELGFDAFVLHPRPGFRFTSFSHAPPVVTAEDIRLNRGDVVVLPEDGGLGLLTFARGARKVLFNQNAYYSFRGFDDLQGALPPYRDPEFVASLAVSEDNRHYLNYAFPGLECRRIHLALDFELFSWVPLAQKRNTLAFMTRKNRAEVTQVIQILRSRGSMGDWSIAPIENRDETGVARIMGEAKMFLAFGHPEGISLSNLEAMARGCRVVGYSGMGCREYFAQDRCREVPAGDVIAFARAVEEEIARFDAECPALAPSLEAASRHVREHYSPERERADLLDVYSALMAKAW
jgi:glycosyltransferase involved in cell wall biosynthesis